MRFSEPKKLRTASGAPSAHARRTRGGGRGLKPGTYPVFDVKSAKSAIRLRGQASNPNAVLNKVARSPYAKNPQVKRMLTNARRGRR